ncbi:transposase [Shewanella surugensis]|uniref:Transposase n=1 Tax=Shewanella surugensis TaxID=212020 RepID=A0ABT0LIE4_9GAMM|nr:transposase [Shewanella surugensis]MCL1127466.1 transposase [Shewanella surugensis]
MPVLSVSRGNILRGWDTLYNGSAGEAQRGLEISTISITDLASNTAYALDSRQTIDEENKTRIDLYAEHLVDLVSKLHQFGVRYLSCDTYYTKVKFVQAGVNAGVELIGKLRINARLQWLYDSEYSGVGRPKKFDGRVKIDTDLARFDPHGKQDNNVEVYDAVIYSSSLKRNIKRVQLKFNKGNRMGQALLYSTDIDLDAMTLIHYYKARFQIEFLFRDAKQHTGLTHSQSLRKDAINMQVNASLTALNLLKIEDRQTKNTQGKTVISIVSWKRRKFNQHLMDRLFDELGLDRNNEKVATLYEQFSDYGAIAHRSVQSIVISE